MFCVAVTHLFGRGSCQCNKYDRNDHGRTVFYEPIARGGIFHGCAGKLHDGANKEQEQPKEKLKVRGYKQEQAELVVCIGVRLPVEHPQKRSDDHNNQENENNVAKIRVCVK